MKKVFAVLLAVLMVAAIFAGCQTPNTKNTLTEKNLSDDRLYDIQLAFYDSEEYFGGGWTPWYDEGYYFGIFYLGSANGYDFLYCEMSGTGNIDGTPVIPTQEIGGVEFYGATDALWAYKGGKIYSLDEVYNNAKVSQKLLGEIKEAYDLCYLEVLSVPISERNEGFIRWIKEYHQQEN